MVRSTVDSRPSPLAGRWYPGTVDALTAMLDRFLKAVPPRTFDGKLFGLLAPHAGIQYSGPVAAHAYALVRGMSFDTVVVAGPMHHPINGAVITTGHTHYETPLGRIPIDLDALDAIGQAVHLTRVRNDPEHSVEIELPFLQHVLKDDFSLIPLMLRDQSESQAEVLGAALADALSDRRALIVASSDLSHFYTQNIANQLDATTLDCIAAMDAQRLVEYNEQGKAFACGYGAIASTINAVRKQGAAHAQIVGYGTSGDVTGDLARVVGYGAAAFCS